MKTVRIIKPDKTLKGKIQLPSSKSISNRLLIMQAVSGEKFSINNLSRADDTVILQKLLNTIDMSANQKDAVVIDCSNSGADLRFLTALLAIKPGRWVLTGTDRMKQRPVGELVDSLKQLGASVEYLGNVGFPPLLIKGRKLGSCDLHINAGISSQFISALLMIGPYLSKGLTLHLKGDVVSEPYINMTVKLMKECGIKITKWKHEILIEPGTYSGNQFTIEPDWSAASFWYQAAALADNVNLELPGLSEKSMQGDSLIASAFTVFGVHSEFGKIKVKKAMSHEPRARSEESRAMSHEPRARSEESRAMSHEPRPRSEESRAMSHEPRARSEESRAMSHEPRAMSEESRAMSHEPRARSEESRAMSHEPRARSDQSMGTVILSKTPSIPEGFYYDFTHHPDLALPMIATCAALGLRGRFEGLKSLAIKESDRVRSLTTELQKLGCKLKLTTGDFPVIEIQPSKLLQNPDAVIDTYRDHRMAMTFAMLALKTGSIRIADPEVVTKSYPGFWEDLDTMGFKKINGDPAPSRKSAT